MLGQPAAYAAMKDSGLAWIGEVPEHWQQRKLRTVLRQVAERNRPDLPLLSVVREKGVILRDVANREENRNVVPDDLSNYKVVRPGQLALNKMKAWQGSYGVSLFDGVVSPAYFVFDVEDVTPEFLHLALRSRAYVPFFAQASEGVRVGQWDLSSSGLKEIPFLVPTPAEQKAISRYLRYLDSRILVHARSKQQLVSLLASEHKAAVDQLVLRGLRPLTPSRASGVNWIGEIPAHWDVLRAKYLFREVDDRTATGAETHLSMSQRLGLVPSDMVEERTLVSESYAGGKLCKTGDLVLNRLKAHLGVFAVARQDGVISPDYTVLRPCRPLSVDYYEAVLRSNACRAEFRVRAKGIVEGFWRLYTDDFYDIRLPVPPLDEQMEIARSLQSRATALESVTSRAEREIELLREYRVRMVVDVVTGKRDVTAVAAALPDVLENIGIIEQELDEAQCARGDAPMEDLDGD